MTFCGLRHFLALGALSIGLAEGADLIPAGDNIDDVGTAALRWNDGRFGGALTASTATLSSAAASIASKLFIKQIAGDDFAAGAIWQRNSTLDSWAMVVGADNKLYLGYATAASAANAAADFGVRVNIDTVGAILPGADNTADLGSASFRWNDGFFGGAVSVGGALTSASLVTTGQITAGYDLKITRGGTNDTYIQCPNSETRFYAGTGAELWLGANGGMYAKITTGGHFAPMADNSYDLGTSALRWNEAFFGGNVLTSAQLLSGSGTSIGYLNGRTLNFYNASSGASYVNLVNDSFTVPALTFTQPTSSTALLTAGGNVVPGADSTYALGSASFKWSDLRTVLINATGLIRTDFSGAGTAWVSNNGANNIQIHHPASGPVRIHGNGGIDFLRNEAGTADGGVVGVWGNVVLGADNTYDLGKSAMRWRDGKFSGVLSAGSVVVTGAVAPTTVANGEVRMGAGRVMVGGILSAKEIKVTSTGADYVFAPDYQLMPLLAVEEYVLRERHLPGVMSAKMMQESGLPVSEMITIQLAKIEELTLYSIAADKKVAMLQGNVAMLQVNTDACRVESAALKADNAFLREKYDQLERRLLAIEAAQGP